MKAILCMGDLRPDQQVEAARGRKSHRTADALHTPLKNGV
jgi:hypothetical protein